MRTETIRIEGMTCGGCVVSVKNALQSLPIVRADVEIGTVTVEYDESKATHEEIERAITDAGFDLLDAE